MPVKARKGSVLRALVLQEQRALLSPELLQVPETTRKHTEVGFGAVFDDDGVFRTRAEGREKVERRRGVVLCCLLCFGSLTLAAYSQGELRMYSDVPLVEIPLAYVYKGA